MQERDNKSFVRRQIMRDAEGSLHSTNRQTVYPWHDFGRDDKVRCEPRVVGSHPLGASVMASKLILDGLVRVKQAS